LATWGEQMSDLHGAVAALGNALLKTAIANDQHKQAERVRGALAAYFENRDPSLADLATLLESLSSVARTISVGGYRGASL
jgi:hypothetical protein